MSNTDNPEQIAIDAKNKVFWDELCGSSLAKSLGITDHNPESLQKFDDQYLNLYPYLRRYLPVREMRATNVLEIGLGFGTVAQLLMNAGAHYHGLDIAAGPVSMVNYRAALLDLPAPAQQGSILAPPYDDETFDWIISIGCLHHTGDMTSAIGQVHRLLTKGGRALIMVYNGLSYRNLLLEPIHTVRRAMSWQDDHRNKPTPERIRRVYDSSKEGAAPETEFVTTRELWRRCQNFHQCQITQQNIGAEGPLRFVPRPLLLKTFGHFVGLDLYCELQK